MCVCMCIPPYENDSGLTRPSFLAHDELTESDLFPFPSSANGAKARACDAVIICYARCEVKKKETVLKSRIQCCMLQGYDASHDKTSYADARILLPNLLEKLLLIFHQQTEYSPIYPPSICDDSLSLPCLPSDDQGEAVNPSCA